MAKKVFFSIAFAMLTLCNTASAQVTHDVRKVEAVNNEYFVVVDDERIEVAPLFYKIIEQNPSAYCLVEVCGTKSFFKKTAVETPEYKYVFEVAKVGMEANTPTVYMTNGYKFSDPDLNWLAVLRGQHVQISRYVGLTREFIVFETVSRTIALTENVTAAEAAAPIKSRLQKMINEVEIKKQAKEKATVTELAEVVPVSVKSAPTLYHFGKK